MAVFTKGMASSNTEEWATPRALFAEFNREFGFTLDVCASPDNAKCERYFTRADNGLAKPWEGAYCWMNPPYGRTIGKWMAKAYWEAKHGATVVCLMPARTDTAWWHDYVAKGEVRFLRGRVRFGAAKCGAPFPSAIVVFRPATQEPKA